MWQMRISFLNGRHIVGGEYFSSLKEFWSDHKSYTFYRTVLLLDCHLVAHLSFDNLSR